MNRNLYISFIAFTLASILSLSISLREVNEHIQSIENNLVTEINKQKVVIQDINNIMQDQNNKIDEIIDIIDNINRTVVLKTNSKVIVTNKKWEMLSYWMGSANPTNMYNKCIERFPNYDWDYSCENFVRTMAVENTEFKLDIVSKWNDHWLCQLNYKRHALFIDSIDFKDGDKQINYCLSVREDAHDKWLMPWYWHRIYDSKKTILAQQIRKAKRDNIQFSTVNEHSLFINRETPLINNS